jgi:hypothetical protein
MIFNATNQILYNVFGVIKLEEVLIFAKYVKKLLAIHIAMNIIGEPHKKILNMDGFAHVVLKNFTKSF